MGGASKHRRTAGTHDIDAEWVFSHHYLRLHEISWEKNDKGDPQYGAMIFIAGREQTKQIACVWLDVFGGSGASSIGVADPKKNGIPFVFKDDSGATVFANDFVYDPKTDAW